MRYECITSVLIGASNVQQIEENVAMLRKQCKQEFSKEELARIDEMTMWA